MSVLLIQKLPRIDLFSSPEIVSSLYLIMKILEHGLDLNDRR